VDRSGGRLKDKVPDTVFVGRLSGIEIGNLGPKDVFQEPRRPVFPGQLIEDADNVSGLKGTLFFSYPLIPPADVSLRLSACSFPIRTAHANMGIINTHERKVGLVRFALWLPGVCNKVL
jgi:hypothetical protein